MNLRALERRGTIILAVLLMAACQVRVDDQGVVVLEPPGVSATVPATTPDVRAIQPKKEIEVPKGEVVVETPTPQPEKLKAASGKVEVVNQCVDLQVNIAEVERWMNENGIPGRMQINLLASNPNPGEFDDTTGVHGISAVDGSVLPYVQVVCSDPYYAPPSPQYRNYVGNDYVSGTRAQFGNAKIAHEFGHYRVMMGVATGDNDNQDNVADDYARTLMAVGWQFIVSAGNK